MPIGYFAPVAYSINLLTIAVMFFSSVTYVLLGHGVLKLNAAAESNVTQEAIAYLYFWHFLKAVPLPEVNETLHWKEPLTYEIGWTGLVLLLFKLAVIVPVIAAFALYWKQVEGRLKRNELLWAWSKQAAQQKSLVGPDRRERVSQLAS